MELRGNRAWRNLLLGAGVLAFVGFGCAPEEAPKPVVKYENLGPRKVPEFLKGTILERADLLNTEPYDVSSFGLVANLRETGDCAASTAVREYMTKQMLKHQFGAAHSSVEDLGPQRVLNDSHFAI